VVIVDHGSRRQASNDMLVAFCSLYQQLTQHPIVEPAHMEIAEPTIAQAVGACV
jgi:sirohydrochlorin ferrochelatase